MTTAKAPPGDPTAPFDNGLAALLALVRNSGPLTRAEMTAATGWARVTVTNRLERLLENGILTVADGVLGANRGRPAAKYHLDAGRAVLLVADIGASGMQLARVDLKGHVESIVALQVEIGAGPDHVLGIVHDALESLAVSADGRPVWGLAVSLPGPVDFAAGRVVTPPIMTGWDGVPIRDLISGWFDCPVLVDNDANAMAVGEQVTNFPSAQDLLVVKLGTGVGCGIISGGHVMRGGAGAAGDIGHTWADIGDSADPPLDCRCGKRGCLEAYVGGWAIARDVSAALNRSVGVDDVVKLLSVGDATTVRLVRDAGRVLGASLATAVSLLNPTALVLGGQVSAAAGDHLLAGVRERVYTRALPLATRHLNISVSTLWPTSGIHGLAQGIADIVLTGADPLV